MIQKLPRYGNERYGFLKDFVSQYSSDHAESSVLLPASSIHMCFGLSKIDQYIFIFDRDTPATNGDNPMLRIRVAGMQNYGMGLFELPWALKNGLFICNSLTEETLTLGAEDTYFYVQVD